MRYKIKKPNLYQKKETRICISVTNINNWHFSCQNHMTNNMNLYKIERFMKYIDKLCNEKRIYKFMNKKDNMRVAFLYNDYNLEFYLSEEALASIVNKNLRMYIPFWKELHYLYSTVKSSWWEK